MKKQFLYFTATILMALSTQAQDKQRIYSLHEGEKLLMEESALRTSATANSYMILVERENINSPLGGTTYHIITDKDEYGPYGEFITDYYSGNMKRRATVLPDLKNDPTQRIEINYILFDDGKMLGPYDGFPSVAFNEDGSDWAIIVSKYDEATNTSSTTIRFKSGSKDLFIKGPEYVQFAPKGNTSVRVGSMDAPDGNIKTTLHFSDGRKYGPWQLNNYEFSEDGKSYITMREEKDGTRILSVNDIETRFDANQNVSSYFLSPDASDWVAVSYQDDRARLIFKNGTESETYERLTESSILYDPHSRQWMWLAASQQTMTVDFYIANKLIHSFPFTEKDLTSDPDNPYFYVGGFSQLNKDGSQAIIQYNVNSAPIQYFLYSTSGEGIKEIDSKNIVNSGFDGKNRPYFIKEKPGRSDDEPSTYYMEGSTSPKFRHYPDELNFIENSDNWYLIYWGDNALQLSDGSYFQNVFDIKYDKATKKLTWLSLEGRDLYVNRKAF